MAKYIVTVYLLLLSINSYTQTSWVQKEVGNNIYVKFPKNPVYKLTEKARTYTSGTKNNLFIVLVANIGIPNYGDFENQPQEQKDAFIDMLLENYIIGFLKATGNEDRKSTSIQIGDYRGKEISFSSISPSTGNRTMNNCKFMFALNYVYTFQCKSLRDGSDGEEEKDKFLISIMFNLGTKSDTNLEQSKISMKNQSFSFKEALKTVPLNTNGVMPSSGIMDELTDVTGLDIGKGAANVSSLPAEYEEMNRELHLNLSAFTERSPYLDRMLKKYERGKLIKKIVGGIAILLTGIILTREYFRMKKQNKLFISEEEKSA